MPDILMNGGNVTDFQRYFRPRLPGHFHRYRERVVSHDLGDETPIAPLEDDEASDVDTGLAFDYAPHEHDLDIHMLKQSLEELDIALWKRRGREREDDDEDHDAKRLRDEPDPFFNMRGRPRSLIETRRILNRQTQDVPTSRVAQFWRFKAPRIPKAPLRKFRHTMTTMERIKDTVERKFKGRAFKHKGQLHPKVATMAPRSIKGHELLAYRQVVRSHRLIVRSNPALEAQCAEIKTRWHACKYVWGECHCAYDAQVEREAAAERHRQAELEAEARRLAAEEEAFCQAAILEAERSGAIPEQVHDIVIARTQRTGPARQVANSHVQRITAERREQLRTRHTVRRRGDVQLDTTDAILANARRQTRLREREERQVDERERFVREHTVDPYSAEADMQIDDEHVNHIIADVGSESHAEVAPVEQVDTVETVGHVHRHVSDLYVDFGVDHTDQDEAQVQGLLPAAEITERRGRRDSSASAASYDHPPPEEELPHLCLPGYSAITIPPAFHRIDDDETVVWAIMDPAEQAEHDQRRAQELAHEQEVHAANARQVDEMARNRRIAAETRPHHVPAIEVVEEVVAVHEPDYPVHNEVYPPRRYDNGNYAALMHAQMDAYRNAGFDLARDMEEGPAEIESLDRRFDYIPLAPDYIPEEQVAAQAEEPTGIIGAVFGMARRFWRS